MEPEIYLVLAYCWTATYVIKGISHVMIRSKVNIAKEMDDIKEEKISELEEIAKTSKTLTLLPTPLDIGYMGYLGVKAIAKRIRPERAEYNQQ